MNLGAALAAHPFFSGLETRLIDEIAACTHEAHFPAGTWIALTGTPADRFHALVGGRAGIELNMAGRDPLLVATVHRGEVLGWSWFVEPYRWTFDVVSLDEVTSLAIDAAGLRAKCDRDHELGYQLGRRLARVVASRLDATRHQLVDVYGRD